MAGVLVGVEGHKWGDAPSEVKKAIGQIEQKSQLRGFVGALSKCFREVEVGSKAEQAAKWVAQLTRQLADAPLLELPVARVQCKERGGAVSVVGVNGRPLLGVDMWLGYLESREAFQTDSLSGLSVRLLRAQSSGRGGGSGVDVVLYKGEKEFTSHVTQTFKCSVVEGDVPSLFAKLRVSKKYLVALLYNAATRSKLF